MIDLSIYNDTLKMQFNHIFIAFALLFSVSTALECKVHPENPYNVASTIIVGNGNVTTIAQAIASIPSGNDQWIAIFLNGVYKEKITIPYDKECIILVGSSPENAIITYDDHATTIQSVTFTVLADNFIAKKITFQNSYRASEIPAVAFLSAGDRHAFYKCRFEGYQDTLWDERGRHYFNDCYIEGAVDFIFGSGQSVYEPCLINVTGGGYITAQNRGSASDPNGYVFSQCHVTGRGGVDLGRAYGPFSRVIFKNSEFDNVISPEGWDIWRQQGHEQDVVFGEFECTGEGANTAHRVPWEQTLSEAQMVQYTTNNFHQSRWLD